MAVVMKVPNPHSMGNKLAKAAGKTMVDQMLHHAPKGAHVDVTEAIAPGQYTFTVSENADGHIQFDLTPGVVA